MASVCRGEEVSSEVVPLQVNPVLMPFWPSGHIMMRVLLGKLTVSLAVVFFTSGS